MSLKFFLLSLFLSLPLAVFAADQTITLKDGSQIKGELVGIANGVYTIKSPTMGELHITGSEVSNISMGAAPAPAPQDPPAAAAPQAPSLLSNTEAGQKMQAMQAQLLANPEYIAEIQQMMQDPDIMQIMADPSFLEAVTTKDVNAIQNNPRTQELLNNPKMKAFIEKVRGGAQPSS